MKDVPKLPSAISFIRKRLGDKTLKGEQQFKIYDN